MFTSHIVNKKLDLYKVLYFIPERDESVCFWTSVARTEDLFFNFPHPVSVRLISAPQARDSLFYRNCPAASGRNENTDKGLLSGEALRFCSSDLKRDVYGGGRWIRGSDQPSAPPSGDGEGRTEVIILNEAICCG